MDSSACLAQSQCSSCCSFSRLRPDTFLKHPATIIGLNLADDYTCSTCWGGKTISQAQIAAWATYARAKLPGLPLGVRIAAGRPPVVDRSSAVSNISHSITAQLAKDNAAKPGSSPRPRCHNPDATKDLRSPPHNAAAHTTSGEDSASRSDDGGPDVTISSPGTPGTGARTSDESAFNLASPLLRQPSPTRAQRWEGTRP